MRKIGGQRLALVAIFVVGFGLRIWGLDFGLPYLYHFDEHFYISAALNIGNGIFVNSPYNPTGFSNFLFPQFAVYFVTGKLTGAFPTVQAFEAAYRLDPSVFFLLGRLSSALFGAATTIALFILSSASNKAGTSLLAAAFLAASFLHVRDSHYAVPDIAMSFFVVLAVGLAAAGLRRKAKRRLYWAGFAGGLAIATKWTSFPVALPVLWAALCISWSEQRTIARKLVNRTTLFALLALGLGLLLGSPQLLIDPIPYLRHLLGIQDVAQVSSSDATYAEYTRLSFYWKTLLYGAGTALALLGIAGGARRVFLAVRTRDPMSVLLLAFPLLYPAIIAVNGFKFARYLLPVIPFLLLFAAEAVTFLTNWVPRDKIRLRWFLAGMLFAIAIARPLADSVRHGIIISRTDTRTLAKQWIETNIPEGSKIAVDWPVHGPPLSTAKDAVPYSERVFDVLYVGGGGLYSHSVEWYEEQGFNYLVTSSFISNNMAYGGRIPEKRAFYDTLGGRFTLIQEFPHYLGEDEPPFLFLDEIYGPAVSLWQRARPGPTIKIYAVSQSDVLLALAKAPPASPPGKTS